MIGHFIALVFKSLSIYRWNNFPRIHNVTETDNLAFVLHTVLLLSYIIKEKEKIDINILFIFKKIIFSSFITFVLSDINSELKTKIKKRHNLIWAKLELKVYNTLLALDMPERMKNDFQTMLQTDADMFGQQFKLENRIIKFAKLRVARQEANDNAVVYKDVYSKVLKSIDNSLNSEEYEMFAKYMDKDLNKYLMNIKRLQFSYRWNMTRRVLPVSVMGHLYIVFFLSYLIGILEDLPDNKLQDIMIRGLYHDIPETLTGDVITPTKKAVPGFEEALTNIEEEMMQENMLIYLKNYEFSTKIKKHMLNSTEGETGALMKLADNFSAFFEAKIESKYSTDFDIAYRKLKRMLNKQKYGSVDYMFKFGVDYFDDNLDDVIRL